MFQMAAYRDYTSNWLARRRNETQSTTHISSDLMRIDTFVEIEETQELLQKTKHATEES